MNYPVNGFTLSPYRADLSAEGAEMFFTVTDLLYVAGFCLMAGASLGILSLHFYEWLTEKAS